jgi:transcriptional regulator with XRE-family HTH domain
VLLRTTFAHLCRDTRIRLGLTQRQLAEKVGVTRGYVANIELGRANPTLGLVTRVAAALDLEVELAARPPVLIGDGRQRDFVHARCSAHVDRRFRSAGWLTAREVEIVHGRSHGWMDLLAFDPQTGMLVLVEIKTRLDDIGAIERQLGWYERSAFEVARRLAWRPRRIASWLLVLCSSEVEESLRLNRELMANGFPTRARAMTSVLMRQDPTIRGRGLALIDPVSKRRVWLMTSRIDGRRSPPPYSSYADAARQLAA